MGAHVRLLPFHNGLLIRAHAVTIGINTVFTPRLAPVSGVGQHRPGGYKSSGIQDGVAAEVVVLDMIQGYRWSDEGVVHELTHQSPQPRILINVAKIGLEMHVVDRVESNQGGSVNAVSDGPKG